MSTQQPEIEKELRDIYITPELTVSQSLADALKDNDFRFNPFLGSGNEQYTDEEVNGWPLSFIIADPGYGKSKFIEKLCRLSSANGLQIDCRDFDMGISSSELSPRIAGYTHIYFDGLDEVQHIRFSQTLRTITKLVSQNPEKHFFISCRTHYLQKFSILVDQIEDARFIRINAFDGRRIRTYLEHHLLGNPQLINALVEKSQSDSTRKSILSTPRYLDALVRSINESDFDVSEIADLKTSHIFEKVIYFKLISDVRKKLQYFDSIRQSDGNGMSGIETLLANILEKSGAKDQSENEVYITQRVLEKLAFIMEISQQNWISKSELVTFLDETHSNINLIFLGNSSIDTFIERTLKATKFDFIEFEHTEFQEYLAAKELIRLGNHEQVLYDLILQQDINSIHLNWYDVMRYAMELESSSVIPALISYMKKDPSRHYDERLCDLLLGPGTEKLGEEQKAELFERVFNCYMASDTPFFAKRAALATLYSEKYNAEHSSVREITAIGTNAYDKYQGYLTLIGSLAENGKLSAEKGADWEKYLLSLLQDKNIQPKRAIYWCLEALSAGNGLISLYPELCTHGAEELALLLNSLARACPDEAADILCEVIRDYPLVEEKEFLFDSMTSVDAIGKVLDLLIDNPAAEDSLFRDDQSSVGFESLFLRVKDAGDAGIIDKLGILFGRMASNEDNLYSRGTKKGFMDQTLVYLLQSSSTFIDQFAQMENLPVLVEEFAYALSGMIGLGDFSKIHTKISDDFLGNFYLGQLARRIATDHKRDAQDIAGFREKFPDLFGSAMESGDNPKKMQEQENDQLHKRFELLKNGTARAAKKELFSFYSSNHELLLSILPPGEHGFIEQELEKLIDVMDPDTVLIDTPKDSQGLSFTVSDQRWFDFDIALKLAFELNLSELLERNRSKILKFLPIYQDFRPSYAEVLSHIVEFFDGFKPADIDLLEHFCAGRKDDYMFIAVKSFSNLIERYQLRKLKPLLTQYVNSEKINWIDKQAALEAFGSLAEGDLDKVVLEKVFLDRDRSKTLSNTANEFLILKYMDQGAIGWRFELMKKHLQRDVISQPQDYHQQQMDIVQGKRPFMSCFSSFPHAHFNTEMYDLLIFALTIRNDNSYIGYSDKILKVVAGYFTRYAGVETILHLGKLLGEERVRKFSDSFRGHLLNIENSFLDKQPGRRNMSDAVKIYNGIKSKSYLPVYNTGALNKLIGDGLSDLEDFVRNQGYKQMSQQLAGVVKAKTSSLFNEDILQKTLKLYLENYLLRKGLRESDIHREVELFDGKRLDLLINYGFLGPVMMELKLLSNNEITDKIKMKAYKIKLKQYISATNAVHVHYVIFRVKNDPTKNDIAAYNALVSEYADISNLQIHLIDCI